MPAESHTTLTPDTPVRYLKGKRNVRKQHYLNRRHKLLLFIITFIILRQTGQTYHMILKMKVAFFCIQKNVIAKNVPT